MKNKIKISFYGLVLMLFMVTSICRLATSIYLPALPVIGENLHLEETVLGLTLTVYFFGFSFFTLIAGPLSDAWGRRRVLLAGIVLFVAGSLVCALAQGGIALLAGRLLQAIGACSVPVTSRAVIRDAFEDHQVITVIGWLGVLGALIPSIAPILGGAITEYAGWRYTFGFLAVTSFLIMLFACKGLPETLPEENRQPLSLSYMFNSFLTMLTHTGFLCAIIPVVFCFAIQGLYFTCAPFVFIKQLHLTPTEFGLTNLVLVSSLVSGRILCPFLVKRLDSRSAYMVCGVIAMVAGMGFLMLFFISTLQLWHIFIPAGLFGLSFGALVPIGVKDALTFFRSQSGAASALYGSLTRGASGVFSALAGFGMSLDIKPVYVLSGIAFCCCLIIMLSTLYAFLKNHELATQ